MFGGAPVCALWRVFKRGGNWNNASIDGLFASNVNNDSSNSNTNNGSRLLLSKAYNMCTPYPLVKNKFGGTGPVAKSNGLLRNKRYETDRLHLRADGIC